MTARIVTTSATLATAVTNWESTPQQGTKQTVLCTHLLKDWHKYHLSSLSFKQTQSMLLTKFFKHAEKLQEKRKL